VENLTINTIRAGLLLQGKIVCRITVQYYEFFSFLTLINNYA